MSKIIGQDKLIKEVNRIFQVFVNSNCKIRPHFILTGESGSGKSFTIKQLCDMNELNFLEVNAAQITKEGISGNSLSKILSPLVNYSHTPESTASVQNEYITSNTLSAPNISSSIFSKSKKPYYNILLDDRAGLEESYEILKYVVDEIKLNQQGNQ